MVDMPAREIDAARLYSAGWAPMIVTVKEAQLARSGALEDLGILVEESWRMSREVLIRQGVPTCDILVFEK